VSLKVELQRGTAPLHPLAVVPLFFGDFDQRRPGLCLLHGSRRHAPWFFEYRTTGHGQATGDIISCSGPAEEFCRRQHTLKLDGVTLKSFTPWRACATSCTLAKTEGDAGVDYCLENPCGAVTSVKSSSRQLCPGSESPPLTIDAPELATPGTHQLSWAVRRSRAAAACAFLSRTTPLATDSLRRGGFVERTLHRSRNRSRLPSRR